MQANRNGFYYVLDRTNGKFLHGTPFIKNLNWATGLTPEGRPIRVPEVMPTMQGTRTCPPTAGATNWHSPAYNPATGLFYVGALEGCGINYKSRDTFRPGGFPFMATGYVEDPEEPWQMYVRALEVTTREAEMGVQADRIQALRGGASLHRRRAYLRRRQSRHLHGARCRHREALWHFNTGRQITASPISYSFKGQQYVAVAAGANVMAFGLHSPPGAVASR